MYNYIYTCIYACMYNCIYSFIYNLMYNCIYNCMCNCMLVPILPCYQPPSETTPLRSLERAAHAPTVHESHNNHTQPTTRPRGLHNVLYRAQIDLDLVPKHRNPPWRWAWLRWSSERPVSTHLRYLDEIKMNLSSPILTSRGASHTTPWAALSSTGKS